MNLQPYLDFTTSLAYRAGRITLGYFNIGIRPDFKANQEPVTAADRAAEEFIRAEIERVYPGHAIIGEEFGESAGNGDPFRWTVDPIDGTITFVRGVPLYSVLIGLEIEGLVKVGAAYFPALDEMIYAAEGLGCWWNGRRAHVSDTNSMAQACVCCSDFQNLSQKNSTIVSQFEKQKSLMRTWADGYGYLLVASGRAEVCLDPYMQVWDCGPYPIIMKEAGGYFGSWSGEDGHAHGEALATNAALKPEVLKLMRGSSSA